MPPFDNRPSSTRLYVGRFSSRTREHDLDDLFSRYGRVRNVDMKHDFAFVDFSDPRDADDARYALDGKDVDGSRIIVEFAKGAPRGPGGSREYLGKGPPPGSGCCFNCGKDGHWARDCTAGDWKNKCYRCGDRGHIEKNCKNSPIKSRRGRGLSVSPRRGRSCSRSHSRHRSYSRSRSSERERSVERVCRRSRSPKRARTSPSASKSRRTSSRYMERSPRRERASISPKDCKKADGSDYSGSPRGRRSKSSNEGKETNKRPTRACENGHHHIPGWNRSPLPKDSGPIRSCSLLPRDRSPSRSHSPLPRDLSPT